MTHNYSVLREPNRQERQLFHVKVVKTPVIVRKVMEMSRLTAQLTAATTDTALPLTPIGKISLMTTYTTDKTTDEGTKTTNHAWLQGWVQTFGRYLFITPKNSWRQTGSVRRQLTWSEADGERGHVHQQADQRGYL